MTVYIDTPAWTAHGRLWAHLVSDTSIEELHAFAAAAGIPRRGFERDHYDVPSDRWDDLVARGAVPMSSRDIVLRLRAAGMRQPKYPATHPDVDAAHRPSVRKPGAGVPAAGPDELNTSDGRPQPKQSEHRRIGRDGAGSDPGARRR